MTEQPFLQGGGFMGRLIREFPWETTPLGAAAQWPVSLRTVVRLMLTTNHPVFLFWGPDGRCLYNDAYSRSLGGEKHPAILGMPAQAAWPEIWPIIGPQIEQVMSGGSATWHENQLVPIDRHGQREEVYWTYSYSPVVDADAPQGVGGVLVLVTETTKQVRVAQRLQAAEARWRSLFEQAPGFMCLLRGPAHVVEFANPTYLQMFGTPGMIGRTVDQALPWASAQGFIALLDRVFQTGRPHADHGVRIVVPRPDGSLDELYVDYVYQPIRSDAGAVEGIFVLGTDVTAREQTSLALRDSEERLRIACEAADLGIHDYDIRTGTIEWDARVRALWGVGSSEKVTLQTFEDGVRPESMPITSAALARAMDPHGNGRYRAEFDVVNRQSQSVRTVLATGRVRFDGRTPIKLIGTVQDVTEGRLAERALHRRNEQLDLLARTSQSLLTAASEERKLLDDIFGAVAAITGLDSFLLFRLREGSDRLVPTPSHGIASADAEALGAGRDSELLGAKLALGRAWIVDDRTAADADSAFALAAGVLWQGAFPLTANGRLLGAVLFLSRAKARLSEGDVTLIQTICDHVATSLERWRLIRELRATDRQKDEFLAMLAHELRNPLAPISTVSTVLGEKFKSDPAVRGYVQILSRQVQQLSRLVDDLLDVSRIAQGRIALNIETLEVARIVEQALESVQPAMADKAHRVRVAQPQAPVHVAADCTRMVQCLSNLLHNAAKYTDAGGEIRLDVEEAGRDVEISVTDNGSGISGDLLPHVFDLFVQGGQSLDRDKGGLGIGLSIVQRLMQMHGGAVTAYSAGAGRGARFALRLQRAQAPAAGAAPARPAAGPAKRILVVDDNVDAADSMAAALSLDGHQVRAVYLGVDAIACIDTWPPDVVLLDIGLPGMDGYAVAREIRRRHGAAIPLIALTGYGRSEDSQRVVASGFSGHMVKPADIDRLQTMIHEVSRNAGDVQRS